MDEIFSLLAWLSGIGVLLEGYGVWMNARDYVVHALSSARYVPMVRTRILAFAEPRLRQFYQSRFRRVGWAFFFGPCIASWIFLGRSVETAALSGMVAAHLALIFVAWYQLNSVWKVIYALPYDAKQRFVIFHTAEMARLRRRIPAT